MSGTSDGSRKYVAAKLAEDPDYFKKIGAKGGSAPHSKPRGFAANQKLASEAGRRGGLVSPKNKNTV